MKHYFTLFGLFVFAFGLSAQNVRQQNVPRPLAPGLQYSFSISQSMPMPSVPKTANAKPVNSIDGNRPFRTLPQDVAGYAPYDTLLLTKIADYRDNVEQSREEISYDQYGLRKLWTMYDGDRIKEQRRYTYTIGAFNYWTSRWIETLQDDNNSWMTETKDEIEVDGNKNIWKRRTYYTDCATPTIKEETIYDYSHIVGGEVVSDIQYNQDGTVLSTLKREWSDKAGQYIVVAFENSIEKYFQKVVDNYVITESYAKSNTYDGYYKTNESRDYFGEYSGDLSMSFSEDDQTIPSHASGYLRKTEMNTPQEGFTTVITYVYNKDYVDWVSEEKLIKSDNYNLQNVTIGMPISYEQYRYVYANNDYKNGSYELVTKYDGEWLTGNIFHRAAYFDNSLVNDVYVKYDDEGNLLGVILKFNSDGSYYVSNVIDTDRYDEFDLDQNAVSSVMLYTYYNNDHQVTSEILTVEYRDKNELGILRPTGYVAYLKKEGNQWKQLQSYNETFQNGMVKRVEYTYNEDGYPLENLTYIAYSGVNNGEEFLGGKEVYSYSDDGYKVESYELLGISTLKLAEVREYKLLETGAYEETYLEYNDEEKYETLTNASNKCIYHNGLMLIYYYSPADKAFVEYGRSTYQTEYTDDNGVRTYIHYELDDNGNAVFESKLEEKNTENESYSARYLWNKDGSYWRGDYKNLRQIFTVDYSWNTPTVPSYNDEWWNSYEKQYEKEFTFNSNISYEWDEEKKDWKTPSGSTYEINRDGDKLTVIETKNESDGSKEAITTTYSKESGKMVKDEISYRTENDMERSAEFFSFHRSEEYIINEQGLIAQYNGYDYSEDGTVMSENSSVYEYTASKIYPTHIETLTEDEALITVDGLTVKNSSSEPITLFTVQGVAIVTGVGEIQAPVAGIYIVRAGTEARVVVLK